MGKRAVANPHTRATFKLNVLPSIVEWKANTPVEFFLQNNTASNANHRTVGGLRSLGGHPNGRLRAHPATTRQRSTLQFAEGQMGGDARFSTNPTSSFPGTTVDSQ